MITYEYPLNERIRTLLRLEFLFDRAQYFVAVDDAMAHHVALLTIFERHGDRKNRARARLRYVFDRLGVDAVREEFRREYAAAGGIRDGLDRSVDSVGSDESKAALTPPWRITAPAAGGLRVVRQRQPGLVSVAIRPPLGLIFSRALERIADAAEQFSREDALRLTPDQGFLLRSVPEERLPELAAFLGRTAAGPDAVDPEGLITVCSGASTCRLGQIDSRAFARGFAQALRAAAIPPEILEAADIRINGCTNSCAQAPVAGLGLCGVAQTGGGDAAMPHYRLLLGARHGEGRASLNEQAALLPEAEIAGAVIALLRAWQSGRTAGEPLAEFARRIGTGRLAEILGGGRITGENA